MSRLLIPFTYDGTTTIAWSDNQGESGTVTAQFPVWITDSELTFTGTRLGDVSTDITGTEDLHLLEKVIYSADVMAE